LTLPFPENSSFVVLSYNFIKNLSRYILWISIHFLLRVALEYRG
jgi:hypothetical protein